MKELLQFDGLEGFNVAEFTPVEDSPGAVRLSRFPSSLETAYLMPMGVASSRQSTGCEIRVVPAGESIRFVISSPDKARILGFQGDFWKLGQDLDGAGLHEVQINLDPRLKQLPKESLTGCRYSTDVIRLVVERGTLILHSIDGCGHPYRKPDRSSGPKSRWLAYGSSITQADIYGYVFAAAERLGVDVLNKGMSGSCGIEAETVEFLANDCEWDFMTCEWGINVRDTLLPDSFEKRVTAALDILARTRKPVSLITIFPNTSDLDNENPEERTRMNAFNAILRQQVLRRKNTFLRLIEGSEILHSSSWLSGDLLHPTHAGHSQMGERLAGILKRYH